MDVPKQARRATIEQRNHTEQLTCEMRVQLPDKHGGRVSEAEWGARVGILDASQLSQKCKRRLSPLQLVIRQRLRG